jgi:methylenetetrahydrofolate reductase (NADPH)
MPAKTPPVSFEFFPPKTPEMEKKLWDTVLALAPLKPAFVSVTYGAGGGTRERTHKTVARLLRETKLVPAAHLTCVDASRDEVDDVAAKYWETGVRHIVALRGDMPGGGEYQPHPQGYKYAGDLVEGLKHIADFEISVAAFPEKHPDADSVEAGLDYLQRKINAGATRAITQYFFDVQHYFRFVEMARKRGITIPIVPGIMPITNFAQAKKFSVLCGATVPVWLEKMFDGLDAEPEKRNEAAIKFASEQCKKLIAFGAPGLHFYTLNRADLTAEVCKNLA